MNICIVDDVTLWNKNVFGKNIAPGFNVQDDHKQGAKILIMFTTFAFCQIQFGIQYIKLWRCQQPFTGNKNKDIF